MRWAALFEDLEAQAEVLALAERAAEVDERARVEIGRLALADRVAAACGHRVRVRCGRELSLDGSIRAGGADWMLIEDVTGREAIVPLAAVRTIAGLPRFAATDERVAFRLSVRHVLRAVARDRRGVHVHLVDGSAVSGTLDRVTADHLDVAVHAAGEQRRASAVRDMMVVPLSAVAAVVA
jgi:hypothetical protein